MGKTQIFSGNRTEQSKKERELSIVNMLRQDARISNAKIAERTKVSMGTVARSIRKSEGDYIIKYSSLIDFDRLGYFVGTLFIIGLPKDGKSSLALVEFLSASRSINTISRTSDDRLIAEAYFRNMAEFVDFRHFVDEFAENVAEHEIVGEIVKEKFLA